MSNIELLSPAGNVEKLKTAINFGADACYMGLTNYSLRKNAGNFKEDELEEVKYFKIEELQYLDNEGFEWLENLRKVIEV